jgi:ankyrin repeat protein
VDVCDDNDNDSNNNNNKVGVTALIAAARNGHSAVVTLLCNRGANVNATTSSVSVPIQLFLRSDKYNMYIEQYFVSFIYACQTFFF